MGWKIVGRRSSCRSSGSVQDRVENQEVGPAGLAAPDGVAGEADDVVLLERDVDDGRVLRDLPGALDEARDRELPGVAIAQDDAGTLGSSGRKVGDAYGKIPRVLVASSTRLTARISAPVRRSVS